EGQKSLPCVRGGGICAANDGGVVNSHQQPHLEQCPAIHTLAFVPLTCVPFDRTLIDAAALTDAERAYLNGYHAWVYETLAPHLSAADRTLLEIACAEI
ncbi:MAG: M24 family metallopeptidase C-terminal domain-containing protein, partial [Oscillospiraceae bacterium]|nr:M24 family metallopeptidase C-terminal domain-containing protein [Oscillospiraceae bacterium]